MSNETNAHKGEAIESLFKNSLPNVTDAVDKIKEAFGIDKNAKIARAYKTGQDSGKSDVAIRFDNQRTILANIKSYEVGFNQATRMNPYKFIEKFNIPKNIADILIDSLKRKSANPRSIPFIAGDDIEPIQNHFSAIASEVIKYSVCGNENPELFVLWDDTKNLMIIYKMDDVMDAMNNCIDVKITKGGVIYLNPYFSVQRKGGNGVRVKLPKTDIRHGGNNLQVKIKVDKLANEIEPLCSYNV